MSISPPLELSAADREQLSTWLRLFEQAWHEGALAEWVAQRLPAPEPTNRLRRVAFVELTKLDLQKQWAAGRRLSLGSYLERFPELGSLDTVPAELIWAEQQARQAAGEVIPAAEYASRFPRQAADLARLSRTSSPPAVAAAPSGRPDVSLAPLSFEQRPAATGADTSRPGGKAETTEPTASGAQDLSGTFGRYRIVKKLGQGGMGAVYLAHDTQLDRQVALKVPHFSARDGREVVERFLREARSAATIQHPNLCPVYDAGEIGGVHYMTMAYIEGHALSEFLRSGKLTSERRAAALVRKLAQALQEAHGRGIIHRDLKPANVMINQRGEPIIMDFGLARRTGAEDVGLTQTGTVLGTPSYMAPEQARGEGEAIGPRTDIYSLGVILYELLAHQRPFRGEMIAVLGQILTAEPEPPSKYRPGLNQRLESVCLKAMAKRPEDRYATMAALAAALAEFLQSTPDAAGAAGPEVALAPPPASPPGTRPPPRLEPLPDLAELADLAYLAADPLSQTPRSETLSRPLAGKAATSTATNNHRGAPLWMWLAGGGTIIALGVLLAVLLLRPGSHGSARLAWNDPPAQALVQVDGQTIPLADVQQPLRLSAGQHGLIVTCEGYETLTQSFSVERGQETVLPVAMVAKGQLQKPAEKTLATAPAGLTGSVWHGTVETSHVTPGAEAGGSRGPLILVVEEEQQGQLKGEIDRPQSDERSHWSGTCTSNGWKFIERRKPAPSLAGPLPLAGPPVPSDYEYTAQLDATGSLLTGTWTTTAGASGTLHLTRVPDASRERPWTKVVWAGTYDLPRGGAGLRLGSAGFAVPPLASPIAGGPPASHPSSEPLLFQIDQQAAGKVNGRLQRPSLGDEVTFRGWLYPDGATVAFTTETAGSAVGSGTPPCRYVVTLGDEAELHGAWCIVGTAAWSAFAVRREEHTDPDLEIAGTAWKGTLEPASNSLGAGMGMGLGMPGPMGPAMSAGPPLNAGPQPVVLSIDKCENDRVTGQLGWPDLNQRNPLSGFRCLDRRTFVLIEEAGPTPGGGASPRTARRYRASLGAEALTVAWQSAAGSWRESKLERLVRGEQGLALAGTVWGSLLEASAADSVHAMPSMGPLPGIGVATVRHQGPIFLAIERAGDDGELAGTIEWPNLAERNAFSGRVSHAAGSLNFTEKRTGGTAAVRASLGDCTYTGTWNKDCIEANWNDGVRQGKLQFRLLPAVKPVSLAATLWKGIAESASPGAVPRRASSPLGGVSGMDFEMPGQVNVQPTGSMLLVIHEQKERQLLGSVEWPEAGQRLAIRGLLLADGKTLSFQPVQGVAVSDSFAMTAVQTTWVAKLSEDELAGTWSVGIAPSGRFQLKKLPRDLKRTALHGTAWSGAYQTDNPVKTKKSSSVKSDVRLKIERESEGQLSGTVRWGGKDDLPFQGMVSTDGSQVQFTFQPAATPSGLQFIAPIANHCTADLDGSRLSGKWKDAAASGTFHLSLNGPPRLIPALGRTGAASADAAKTSSLPDLEAGLPAEKLAGFAVIHTDDQLDKWLAQLERQQIAWVRLPKSAINEVQHKQIEQWVTNGGVLWTDTDLAQAFGLECLVAPAAAEQRGASRLAKLSHPVLQGLVGTEVAYELSATPVVARFASGKSPAGLLPLIGSSANGVLTVQSAIKEHGKGALVLLTARLAESEAAKTSDHSPTATTSLASRFMSNLRNFSVAVSKGEAKPLGP